MKIAKIQGNLVLFVSTGLRVTQSMNCNLQKSEI